MESTALEAIIIEDESEGIERLLNLIKAHPPHVKVISTGRTNADLIKMIQVDKLKPDLLLLDIKLPDGQVFNALEDIDTTGMEIIFITAYDEYAIKAFEAAAIHYLLKPLSKDALITAVNRVKKHEPGDQSVRLQLELARQVMDLGPNTLEKTGIGSVEGVRLVRYKDIVRLQGDDNYTTFIMADGERIIASRNIGFFLAQYEKRNFVKVHQSHVINFNYIHKYNRGDGGTIQMDNGDEVPLARRQRPDFLEKLRSISDMIN